MMKRFFVKDGSEVKIKILGHDPALEAVITAQGFSLSEEGDEFNDGFDPSECVERGSRELNEDGTYTVSGDRYNHGNREVNGHRYDKKAWMKCSPQDGAAREAKRVEAARVEAARIAALK